MGGGEGISRGRGVIIGSLRHLKLGFKKKKKKKNVGLPRKMREESDREHATDYIRSTTYVTTTTSSCIHHR